MTQKGYNAAAMKCSQKAYILAICDSINEKV